MTKRGLEDAIESPGKSWKICLFINSGLGANYEGFSRINTTRRIGIVCSIAFGYRASSFLLYQISQNIDSHVSRNFLVLQLSFKTFDCFSSSLSSIFQIIANNSQDLFKSSQGNLLDISQLTKPKKHDINVTNKRKTISMCFNQRICESCISSTK